MKPPSDSPHATTFVVFVNCFLNSPTSSTLVLIAESAFQPWRANPEPTTPYPLAKSAPITVAFGPG